MNTDKTPAKRGRPMKLGARSNKLHFFVYPDKKGEWRWRIKAGNGQVMADSGEGYGKKGNCLRAIDKIAIVFKTQDPIVITEGDEAGAVVAELRS